MLATWPSAAQPIFQDPNMVRKMCIASLSSCQSVGYVTKSLDSLKNGSHGVILLVQH